MLYVPIKQYWHLRHGVPEQWRVTVYRLFELATFGLNGVLLALLHAIDTSHAASLHVLLTSFIDST